MASYLSGTVCCHVQGRQLVHGYILSHLLSGWHAGKGLNFNEIHLPDLMETVLPEASIIVSGSCRLSVEHWWSNSTLKPSAPGIRTWPLSDVSSVYGWGLSCTLGWAEQRTASLSTATSSSSVTHSSSNISATWNKNHQINYIDPWWHSINHFLFSYLSTTFIPGKNFSDCKFLCLEYR
jgi:hypothetical protein